MNVNVLAKPLYIEITGGHNTGIPIAVVPFKTNGKLNHDKIANVSMIVHNNLHNSGQFRVLDLRGMRHLPTSIDEVEFPTWQKMGIQSLIVGTIEVAGKDRYNVQFQLVDIFKDSQTPLLSLQYKDQSSEQLRGLAHHISDLIFEQLMGVKGIFSTRIAYITVDQHNDQTLHTLTVADADGHNDKPLVSAPYPLMSPRWSPDGKRIAFVSFRGNRSAIKVVHVESGQIDHVSNAPGINGAPNWSPDGESLAMVLSKDGAPKLYQMVLATKKLTRLTSGGAIDTEPYWDPTGESILFTSNRGGKPQIYRLDLISKGVTRLTFDGHYNATPSLTPDGSQLVMLHGSDDGAYHIAVQNLKTGKVKKLTDSQLDESPTLAPNGMMVLYGTREAHQTVLGAVTLDGRFRIRLPVQDGNVKEPAWSPFLS